MAYSPEQLERLRGLAKSSSPVQVQTRERKSEIRKLGERTLGGALKVIDFIERPYYALMNVGVDFFGGEEGFNPLRAAGRGLAGREKSDFGDVLTEAGWQPESLVGKLTKGGVSFVGGVLLDPITYVTMGAGKGLTVGGRVISEYGASKFLPRVGKALGKKITKVDDLSKLSGEEMKTYSRVVKEFMTDENTWKEEAKIFNKTALRFMGKEVPVASTALQGATRGVSRALKPLMNTQIARRSKETGEFTYKSLGEIFSPGYGIRNSTKYTPAQKWELLNKLEADRSAKGWQEAKDIEETRRLFKNFDKNKQAQVTYELEKLLKYGEKEKTETVIRRIVKNAGSAKNPVLKMALEADIRMGAQTPFTLVEAGRYEEALQAARWIKNRATTDFDKRIVNSTMSEIRAKVAQETFNEDNVAKMISQIKDKDIRKVVDVFDKRMRDLWEAEKKAGLRKPGEKAIHSGYVKRLMKTLRNPEDVNMSMWKRREIKGPAIERIRKEYKAGKRDFYFETSAAKSYAARLNQSHTMRMRNDVINWMEAKGYLAKAGKSPNKNMNRVDLWGKVYETTPELARELKRISPQLDDVGMRRFLNAYDKIQNAWKLSVTSLWPSFHARNAVSNVWLGWLGGNTSVRSYTEAAKVHWYGHKLKKGLKAEDGVIKLHGKEFKISDIWEMAGETGVIGTGWFGGDFIKKLAINKKDPSYWTRLPRRMGTAVENNARIALFLDRLGKGDDVMSAAQHVKKFLFDYGDLTETERKLFKRFAPFYTWMRKNIPLQLEQMAMQPGKYTAMLHGQRGIEEMSPAEEERYLPEWMKSEEMFVRFPGKRYFNPDLPFQDLAKLTLSDRTIKEIVNPISPLIKGVFEIAANRDIFRGKPLADQNLPQSKFAKEKIKQEILNNLRFTSVYKKATSEDLDLLGKFLDTILGLKAYPFDVDKGRRMYIQRQRAERNALRKLEK